MVFNILPVCFLRNKIPVNVLFYIIHSFTTLVAAACTVLLEQIFFEGVFLKPTLLSCDFLGFGGAFSAPLVL